MRYNRICIFLPTYKRSGGKLRKFILSALGTVEDPKSICFSFLTNAGDPESDVEIHKLCKRKVEYEILHEDLGECHLAKFFNQIYEESSFKDPGTCVSMFGDDMVFETPGWERMMLGKMNDMCGYGIVYGDDGIQHEKLCVYFITTRWFVSMTEKPFMCPIFSADWMDNVWMNVAEDLKCAWYLPDLMIRHEHASVTGDFDETTARNREAATEIHELRGHVAHYSDKIVQSVRYQLEEMVPKDLAVVMTTYDRVPLLERTVRSWNKSCWNPEIIVFDDCSMRLQEVRAEIDRMPGAVFRERGKHLGCDGNNQKAILLTLKDDNVQGVMVIDSDTSFSPVWFFKAAETWEKMQQGVAEAGSIFNAPQHKEQGGSDGWVIKSTVGGFGSIYKRSLAEKLKEYAPDRHRISWDNYLNNEMKVPVICSEKSYLQHTGYFMGTHLSNGEMSDYAPDFVGSVESLRETVRSVVRGPILFSAMARMGDVIGASMLANALLDRFEDLTWLVIPIYEGLVRRICSRAKIIVTDPDVGGRYGEWSETNTWAMKARYPRYAAYINAQLGSRENHNEYLSSGKTPCDFMRLLCEDATGVLLSRDYTSHLEFTDVRLDIRGWPEGKVAIISPYAKTIQVMTPKMVEAEYDRLRGEGYDTRILVEKKPERVPIREIRNKYIYGLDILECITLLRKVDMFVGNDSGMAWASLYSKCKKRIYHKADRVKKVNTWFSKLDNRAEDILV